MTDTSPGLYEDAAWLDLERRLAALEAQMRIIRTVMVPALETALGGIEQLQAELRSYSE